jgi:hypothetical protein
VGFVARILGFLEKIGNGNSSRVSMDAVLFRIKNLGSLKKIKNNIILIF